MKAGSAKAVCTVRDRFFVKASLDALDLSVSGSSDQAKVFFIVQSLLFVCPSKCF